jgi:hypothetical protein
MDKKPDWKVFLNISREQRTDGQDSTHEEQQRQKGKDKYMRSLCDHARGSCPPCRQQHGGAQSH